MDQLNVLKLALEALSDAASCVQDNYLPDRMGHDWDDVIAALRQAIQEQALQNITDFDQQAEQAQPVGTLTLRDDMGADIKFQQALTLMPGQSFALYTAAPPRQPKLVQAKSCGYESCDCRSYCKKQAEQAQPVAWLDEEINCAYTPEELDGGSADGLVPLYTAAPLQRKSRPEPMGWITAGQHTAPLRTHWEGCEAVHPECRKPEQAEQAQPVAYRCWNNPKNADGTFGVVRTWISGKPEGDGNEPLYTAAPPPHKEKQAQPEEGEYIEVTARWGKRFVEMPNPLLEDGHIVRFYFDPPPRQPLTDEQLRPLIHNSMRYYGHNPQFWRYTSGAGYVLLARAIEAAHGIKEKNT